MQLIANLVLFLFILAACQTQPPATPTAVPPTQPPATDTPFPLCTPPACTANEVYFCPSDCPGGCGTTCATVTPSAPVDQSAAPATWTELEGWLTAVWQQNANPAAIRAALQTAGWQQNDNEWLGLDFNGDLRDEWVLVLHDPQTPATADIGYGFPGNLWIVNASGVQYRAYPTPAAPANGLNLAPIPSGSGDLTGDGLPELITRVDECGAHTCFGTFRIISSARGPLENIVRAAWQNEGQPGDVISISFPEPRLEDENGDGRLDFLVHGGTIGSVGAGVMRAYTEVWRWDGTAVTLADTRLDPTIYRHHILYEANAKLAAGDTDGALFLYEEAINNPTLETVDFLGTAAQTKAAIDQFAAFRLILIDLQKGDLIRAASRLNWLNSNYPGTAAAFGAAQLINGWTTPDNAPQLCTAVEADLATFHNPTGPLENLGYGNPSLTAVDFCP